MSTEQPPTRARRAELAQAFQHLADLGAAGDYTGATDPAHQWLIGVRTVLPRYGDVGPRPKLDGVTYTPVTAAGVPAEWVTVEGSDPNHRVAYFHGGGWASGSPADYRAFSGTLARLSGASILMVDYRLSPEHRFPAGLEDCVAALAWVALNGPSSAATGLTDRDPAAWLGVGGDSAGGNLAAATTAETVRRGGRVPDRLVLIAGTLDNLTMTDRVGVDDEICTPEAFHATNANYLMPGDTAADPRVSPPVFTPLELLAKFPPTLLQVSTAEALLSDTKKFAARLEAAGVRVSLSLWPDLPHVWHHFFGLFPEAIEASQEIADFIRP